MRRTTKHRPVHARPRYHDRPVFVCYTTRKLAEAAEDARAARYLRRWQQSLQNQPMTATAQINRAIETFIHEVELVGDGTARMFMGTWPRSFAIVTPDPAVWGEPDFGRISEEQNP